MDTATKTAKAVLESELGVEVTSIRLVEEKEFLGAKLAIWRARTQGGDELHLLRVIGPPLIQNLSVESPRG